MAVEDEDALDVAYKAGACVAIAELLYMQGLGDCNPEAYRKGRAALETFGISGPGDVCEVIPESNEDRSLALGLFDDSFCWEGSDEAPMVFDPKGYLSSRYQLACRK